MEIFFDVDYTILGLDGSLRPWTHEVLERLVAEGHRIHVWSGNGERSSDVERHGLGQLVTACYRKPLSNYHASLEELGVPAVPDFAVDDTAEVAAAFGGVWVVAYAAGTPSDYLPRDRDEEMLRVHRVVREYVETGTSSDPRFCARGASVPLFYRSSHGRGGG